MSTIAVILMGIYGVGCSLFGFAVGRSTRATEIFHHEEDFGNALQRQMLKNWIEKGTDG